MRRFWVPVLVLGIAGFDPVGALTFVGAAALRATRRNLGVLALASVLTSWVLSIAAVLGLGATIHALLEKVHVHPSHEQMSWALLFGGLVLLGWGVVRLVGLLSTARGRPTDAVERHREGRTPRSVSASGMFTAGLLVGVSSLVDPAWYAMVAFASTLRHRSAAVVAATIWVLMSHILLVLLALSMLVGLHERLDQLLTMLKTRYARQVAWAITLVLLAAGLGGLLVGMLRLFHAGG